MADHPTGNPNPHNAFNCHADDTPSRSDLAEDRTDLAEDRTLLANERTFSGWARTALATVGIGLGFHVLFEALEPAWVAKAIATLFVALAQPTLKLLDAYFQTTILRQQPVSRRRRCRVEYIIVVDQVAAHARRIALGIRRDFALFLGH